MAHPPTSPSRRDFLRIAAAAPALAACTATPATAASRSRVFGSNEVLRVGVVGLNGRGRDHLAGFRKQKDVRITALCDCDQAILDRELAASKKLGEDVAAFRDVRELLASGRVDAVSVATPNHWHALMGVWAAEHGVHAYVEKPISHDVWEGAQLAAAAQKHRVVIACGSQCRSNPGMQELIAFAQSGALGRITLARGLCYKRRKSIGPVPQDQKPPASVDYSLWLGPAAEQPLRRQQFHYDWHWQWDFGNGDLGNQGVHQMDLCRWAVGCEALPQTAWSFGGRFGYQDAGETPNTLVSWFDTGSAPILFEVRGLGRAQGDDKLDAFLGAGVGVVLHCEHGTVVAPGYAGGAAYDPDGKLVQKFAGEGDHFANFVQAVRAGDAGKLTANARTGALSAAFCHLGNDSWRQGAPIEAAALDQRTCWHPGMHEAFLRVQAHLQQNGLPLDGSLPLRLGALLRPQADARQHPPRAYRAPFVLGAQA